MPLNVDSDFVREARRIFQDARKFTNLELEFWECRLNGITAMSCRMPGDTFKNVSFAFCSSHDAFEKGKGRAICVMRMYEGQFVRIPATVDLAGFAVAASY